MTYASIQLSYSGLASWLNCKRQWYYRYRRNLAPIEQAKQLDIGSAVHAGLEWGLRMNSTDGIAYGIDKWRDSQNASNRAVSDFLSDLTDGPPVDLSDANVALLAKEALPIALRMWDAIDFNQWQTVSINDEPAIEFSFSTHVAGRSSFGGKVDWIAQEQNSGAFFLWEFKTRKVLQPEDNERFDLQKTLYQHVIASRYKIPLAGAVTLQGLTKNPRIPRMNKNGTMDRRPIVTTWEIYRNALLRAGLNPVEYRDMEESLRDVRFTQLDRSYRSAEYCERVWKATVVHNIAAIRSTIDVTATPSINPMRCKQCAFANLCEAELNGYDAEYVERSQYKQRSSASTVA